MSAKIIPLFPDEMPRPFAERLTARRAYRVRCRQVAAEFVAAAFAVSGENVPIGIDDAVPLFVAAMRRELRKAWQF